MKRTKRLVNLIAILILGIPVYAGSSEYITVEGDTLSMIAAKQMSQPRALYSEGGRLSLLIAANPEIKNPNKIAIGAIVTIPDGIEVREPAAAQDTESAATPTTSNPEPAPITLSPAPPVARPLALPPTPETEKQWIFGVTIEASYARIDAKDPLNFGSAVLLSDLTPALTLRSRQHWSEATDTYQEISLAQYRFINVTTGQDVTNPGVTSGFAFGMSRKLISQVKAFAEIGVEQRLFIKTTGASQYEFEKIAIPRTEVGFDHRLHRKGALGIGYAPSLELRLPGSSQTIKADTGYSAGVEIFTDYEKNDRYLRTGIYFRQGNQDADIVDERDRSVGLRFSVEGWGF